MTGMLRQASIDFRRNVGLLFLPLIVVVSWWLLDAQFWTTFLWTDTNRLLPETFLPFACPAIAAAAAWMGGRERRSGIDDLLATTPMPTARRHISAMLATAAWGLIAFCIYAGYVMGQTATQATWGGPRFTPLAVAVVAVLAHAGWGYLAGVTIPSRFTAPLAGMAALGIQQMLASRRIVYESGSSSSTWVNNLAAHNGTSSEHVLLYLGLFALALALLLFRQLPRLQGMVLCTLALAVALAGAVMTWGRYPDMSAIEDGGATGQIAYRNNFGQRIVVERHDEPEPVCAGEPVTVCTHPAFQPVLERGIVDAANLVQPLLGLPDAPMRIEADEAALSGGSIDRAYLHFSRFADRLVADPDTMPEGYLVNTSQIAVRDWLLLRSGWFEPYMCMDEHLSVTSSYGWPSRETCAAMERFDRLPEQQQRAWLEVHYVDLRRGLLTLDDLP